MQSPVAPAQAGNPEPTPVAQSAEVAPAAPQDGDVAEIVVTGTSIRGVAPVGAPVVGLSQAEIQLQPATTTTELLRQVPSVIGTGANENYSGSANNANANITGGNGINLRGLGTEATLTLLNAGACRPRACRGSISIRPSSPRRRSGVSRSWRTVVRRSTARMRSAAWSTS